MICKAPACRESLWFWEQSKERQVGIDNGRQKGDAVTHPFQRAVVRMKVIMTKMFFFSAFRCFPFAIRF